MDGEAKVGQSTLIRWPEQLLGPQPGLKQLNVLCWTAFISFVVVPVSVILWNHLRAGDGFDFVYFYGLGRLATERPIVNLYNVASQLKLFNEICPLRHGYYSPSPYPPFVPLFFAPFSWLSFRAAYVVWMAVSLLLYSVGILATIKRAFPRVGLQGSLLLCFSLAYPPFLLFTLVNGQLASIAVCAIGLATYEESRGKTFWSGVLLSALAYKPTLLLALVPMLILTRRFRALCGLMAGTITLLAASTVLLGARIWPAYVRLVRVFRQLTAGHSSTLPGHFKLWQFVDLNTLSYAIPGGRSRIGLVVLIGLTTAACTWLAMLLWRSAEGDRAVQSLAWASTLSCTLLFNVYAPIYDSSVAAIAIILTLGALKDLRWKKAVRWYIFLAFLTFAVAWKTEAIAEIHGVQLLTILLFILGASQLYFLQREACSRYSDRPRLGAERMEELFVPVPPFATSARK